MGGKGCVLKIERASFFELLSNKTHLGIQMVKYLFCGGITFAVDVAVFYLFAWLVFPCLRPDDPFAVVVGWFGWTVREVSEKQLLWHYGLSKTVCFLASNTVAYFSNVLFVFDDGRHSRRKEVALFYLFSTISWATFTGLSGLLIGNFGWDVSYSYFFVFLLAMVVNFSVRKRVVFKN